jgi:hypothetical protein
VPVVINDFQVVTPSAAEPTAESGHGAAMPAGTDAEEILKRVHEDLRTRRERKERLHAT